MQDHSSGHLPTGTQQRDYSRKTPAGRTSRKTRGKKRETIILFILASLLWLGLVGAGYLVLRGHLQKAENLFTQQISEIKAENQLIAADLQGAMELFEQELAASQAEMGQIRQEMVLIQEEMELTGESITGTDATRQSLAERITELDKQLAGLKEQLRKLEAAVRAL